jgi:hypothetical protein
MAAPPLAQWARLQADYACPLRRGAWYRVLDLTPLEVVVDVHNRSVLVARPYVELAHLPPRRWTVVERPGRKAPDSSGRYAVCPSCRERVPLPGNPPTLRCRRCQGTFEVG